MDYMKCSHRLYSVPSLEVPSSFDVSCLKNPFFLKALTQCMYKCYRPPRKTKVTKKKRKHKSDIYNITVIHNDFNSLAKSGTKLRYPESYT